MLTFDDVKVITVKQEQTFGEFEISPLPGGYGHTMGNAIRRVLLSSLEGAAITSVRIEGVDHEFSTIDGIKESVFDILLNLKRVKFTFVSGSTAQVELVINKAGKYYAKDLKCPSNVKVVTSDVYVLEMSSGVKPVKINMTVEKGIGYKSVEEVEREEIGVIPLDADFTPVKRVEVHVEKVRFKEITDMDKLVLRVYTDGSINPSEAVRTACEIINDLSKHIINFMDNPSAASKKGKKKDDTNVTDWDIKDMVFPDKLKELLLSNGITKFGQLLKMTKSDLVKLPKIGLKSATDIIDFVKENYNLTMGK